MQNEEEYISTVYNEPVEEIKEPEPVVEETTEEAEPEQTPEEIEAAKIAAKKEKTKRRVEQLSAEKLQYKRQYEEALQQIEKLKSGKAEPQTLPDGSPDPSAYQAGEYDPKYIKDLAKYEIRLELAEKEQHAILNQKNLTERQLQDKAREVYEDFDDALDDFNSDPFTAIPQVQEIFDASEDKIALKYYLGKNPAELQKFYDMTPTQALAYIGRLDERIANSKTKSPTLAVKTTNAPKPITPLGSAKGSTTVPDLNAMSTDELFKYWKEEERRKRG